MRAREMIHCNVCSDSNRVDGNELKADLHQQTTYGESVHPSEMGAESGVLCRRFLLPSHPR